MAEEIAQQSEWKITPTAIASAFLDAQGQGPKEISRALGIHEKTVSGWRREPAYLAARERWQNESLMRLEPLIQRERSFALQVHQRALQHLLDALNAEDAEGNPMWAVRAKAADTLASMPVIRALFAVPDDAGGAKANAAAVVHLHVTRNEDGSTNIAREEVVDAEVVSG